MAGGRGDDVKIGRGGASLRAGFAAALWLGFAGQCGPAVLRRDRAGRDSERMGRGRPLTSLFFGGLDPALEPERWELFSGL
jgi:hypothetical protein